MATPGRLRRPPIREALVDLRVSGADRADEATIRGLAASLRVRYPVTEVRHRFQTTFQAIPGAPQGVTQDQGFHALVLKDAERQESRVVQLRTDGFTFSQLTGYEAADDLFREAGETWTSYADAIRVSGVARIALRYINNLSLPYQQGDHFERFLTAPVTMPKGAPQVLSTFLSRAAAVVRDDTTAIVTQKLDNIQGGPTPFILDIDIFRTGRYGADFSQLLLVLNELRAIKNDIFFSFFEDAALEPYR